MNTKETYVRARVDRQLKSDTEQILRELGLTTAEAIRLLMHQIRLQRGLPFDLRLKEDNTDILLPNAMRQSAIDAVYED
ncbi:MAG: type II toxin-antitoxin system RelB/DinJ family antitoxin [Bacteroidia bacterium]|nr:type II toxin-antitoxin system RelB/DinJ family antitoxin [Bacteroidia bacterium]